MDRVVRCCLSTPACGASRLKSATRDVTKWLEVSAIHERPVQRYSAVFGLGEEGQDFVVENDF